MRQGEDFRVLALPGGNRNADGTFANESTNANFWSSSDDGASAGQAWNRNLNYDNSTVNRNDNDKERGYSVRCLRDLIPGGIVLCTNFNFVKIIPPGFLYATKFISKKRR